MIAHPDESYYRDVPETIRLTPITDRIATTLAAVEQTRVAPAALGVLGGILIGAGLFMFGYQLGYAAGVLQPWVDARGWIALLFIAIGFPIYAIWRSNQGGYHYEP